MGRQPQRDLGEVLRRALAAIHSPLANASSLRAGETPSAWAYLRTHDDLCEDGHRRSAQLVTVPDGTVNTDLWLDGIPVCSQWLPGPGPAARLLHLFFVEGLAPTRLALVEPGLRMNRPALLAGQGAAAVVDARWQELLAYVPDAREPVCHLALVLQAAARTPELRQLFPFLSLHRLCFSQCTGFPYSQLPLVSPALDRTVGQFQGLFAVSREWAEVDEKGEPVSRAELLGQGDAVVAAALLVRHLPAGTGPARLGTAEDRTG